MLSEEDHTRLSTLFLKEVWKADDGSYYLPLSAPEYHTWEVKSVEYSVCAE